MSRSNELGPQLETFSFFQTTTHAIPPELLLTVQKTNDIDSCESFEEPKKRCESLSQFENQGPISSDYANTKFFQGHWDKKASDFRTSTLRSVKS